MIGAEHWHRRRLRQIDIACFRLAHHGGDPVPSRGIGSSQIADEIRELILIGASSLELRKKAIEDGMITLRESGLHKIRAGLTTLEEVVRETVA